MPEEMYGELIRRLSRTRYASVSEYVRELIRKDDPGYDKRARSKKPAAKADSEPEPRFIIKTANEWLREGLAEQRGPGLTDL